MPEDLTGLSRETVRHQLVEGGQFVASALADPVQRRESDLRGGRRCSIRIVSGSADQGIRIAGRLPRQLHGEVKALERLRRGEPLALLSGRGRDEVRQQPVRIDLGVLLRHQTIGREIGGSAVLRPSGHRIPPGGEAMLFAQNPPPPNPCGRGERGVVLPPPAPNEHPFQERGAALHNC